MPSKAVILSDGTSFEGIGVAQDFFRGILRAESIGSDLNGTNLAAVQTLYRDYCEATQWPLPGELIGMSRGVDRRFDGKLEITTECFIVTFSDGSSTNFSFLKACSVIANRGRK
jgi:hypothetical protein